MWVSWHRAPARPLGAIGIGAGAPRIGDCLSPRHADHSATSPTIPSVSSRFAKPTKRETISPAILDELDFLKGQLGRQPDRAWLSRMLLLGFGSVWALLAVVLLMLTR
jgi:hypothetical protein